MLNKFLYKSIAKSVFDYFSSPKYTIQMYTDVYYRSLNAFQVIVCLPDDWRLLVSVYTILYYIEPPVQFLDNFNTFT